MSQILYYFKNIDQLIPLVGYAGLVAIIFAESCFLFFLPGDSLLFTAGFFASRGVFDVHTLALLTTLGAIVGNNVGYAFGHKVGKRLFTKEDSVIFNKDHIKSAEVFYEKHGKKTIILARFIPAVRTFAPIVAGIGTMKYRDFVIYNIVGAILWSAGLIYAGYYFGNLFPNKDAVDKYLIVIVLGIIIVTSLPAAYHMLKNEKSRRSLLALVQKPFSKKPGK